MNPEIYQLFIGIMSKNERLKLMNVFRGVPVTYEAQIIEIRGDEVRMRTHPFQLICIRFQKRSYTHYGTKTYKADALSTDMKNETTLLSNFEAAHEIGFRKNVRVEPHIPTQVSIYSDKLDKNRNPWVVSNMADISIKGIAFYMNPFLFTLAALVKDDPIKLKFTLLDPEAGINFPIQVDGAIRNITQITAKRLVRIGAELFPDKNNESLLTRYIAQRQKDILKELKEIRDKDIFTDL